MSTPSRAEQLAPPPADQDPRVAAYERLFGAHYRAGLVSWRQWLWSWPATPGEHVLRCRVVDAAGRPQSEARAAPFPSGASGLHAIRVTVR